jgi:hypothetical protein
MVHAFNAVQDCCLSIELGTIGSKKAHDGAAIAEVDLGNSVIGRFAIGRRAAYWTLAVRAMGCENC